MIRIVDLFAGIGGLRQGVQQGLDELKLKSEIIYTSEIKKTAISVLEANWPEETISGDITKTDPASIPSHDLLLAGFPCQAFSYAGKRLGFEDPTKGTLFFDVARILKYHKPKNFILENVEGLVKHDPDPQNKKAPIGRTLTTILETLRKLGYNVDWKVLEAIDFGIPQTRRRIFILGSLDSQPDMSRIKMTKSSPLNVILERNIKEPDPKILNFSTVLEKEYVGKMKDLNGKIFRDWRGGTTHLHTWNFNIKGKTTSQERALLERLRSESKLIKWRGIAPKGGEGYLLTPKQIQEFSDHTLVEIKVMLQKLAKQGYIKNEEGAYRISSGRLTAPISYIIDPQGYSGTLVATDADHFGVVDNGHLRRYTTTEVKRLFGFKDDFVIPASLTKRQMFDVFGNSVVIPVAKAVVSAIF